MPNKMLIDASHPEETRVVVLRGNRIEEFDFESQDKKQLRGNIYLARVTRVEPSLQAAFVEYGGNRHGFLAFSEIHPDYYQIPVADRQALLRAEAEEAAGDDDDGDEAETRSASKGGRKRRRASTKRGKAKDGEQTAAPETDDASSENGDDEDSSDNGASVMAERATTDSVSEESRSRRKKRGGNDAENGDDEDEVDTVGAEDALDEAQTRRKPVRRNYKIQEVIKRRQILLVQVVKEERGNKGAALTTYMSLAGRYSVLMPNTARGGGISRKITNAQDRKRLKEVVRNLEVPAGMGIILRTAGANRTKAEVKRDYDYLMRMWEKVRTLTLESSAPALVYEEGSLIKRSVRDLYNKEIGEILVAGEEGYREAKDFMRMLMPSHAKAVQPYREATPIFAHSGIEGQLDRMLQPQVTLKSGGYIIINQTEALVAIDVNSGRSTKEHSIEDTALQTNLEAAEEVARQLRLRDLAGLIVIDFIDMEENRNNRAVEKRVKECLKSDRARIQVGRISHFGLLEMSRQRIRASVLESTMQTCPHCGGTGHIRSESSVALFVARSIEEYLLKDARNDIVVRTPTSTALYLLNQKRANLVEMEGRFGVSIAVEADDAVGAQHFIIVKLQPAEKGVQEQVAMPAVSAPVEEPVVEARAEPVDDSEEGNARKRKRKRRRRGGRDRNGQANIETADTQADTAEPEFSEGEPVEAAKLEGDAETGGERKKRHRGKRGGRRNRKDDAASTQDSEAATPEKDVSASDGGDGAADTVVQPVELEAVAVETEAAQETAPVETPAEAEPAKKPRRRTRKAPAKEDSAAATAPADAASAPVEATADLANGADKKADQPVDAPAVEDKKKPARKPAAKRKPAKAVEKKTEEPVLSSSEQAGEEAPRKTGWWQRKGFF